MSTLFIPYLSSGFVFMVKRGHNVKKSRQTGKTYVNNIYRRAEELFFSRFVKVKKCLTMEKHMALRDVK